MSELQDRIVQFRKMANDDPENELGHFRLGQLLMEADDHDEAVKSLRRTLELSPQFSKVYQSLASSLLKLDRRDEAVRVLREGFAVADERGDNMPRDEMARMMGQLGEAVPVSKKAAVSGPHGDGFRCQRPGCKAVAQARKLPQPPVNDDFGRRVQAEICAACWTEWLKDQSIKVINEMRLDLGSEKGQESYDQMMHEFLGFQ